MGDINFVKDGLLLLPTVLSFKLSTFFNPKRLSVVLKTYKLLVLEPNPDTLLFYTLLLRAISLEGGAVSGLRFFCSVCCD